MLALPKFGLENTVVGSYSDYMLHIARVGGGSSAEPAHIATSTSRCIIKLYDAATSAFVADYPAHKALIHDLVAFTSASTGLLRSSTINHQSPIINHQSPIINHQSSTVNHSSHRNDQKTETNTRKALLGSSSADGTTKVWDLRQREAVMMLRDVGPKKKEPLSCSITKGHSDEILLAMGLEDGRSFVWDLRNTSHPQTVHQNHSNEVRCVRFWSPHGSHHLNSAYDDWKATFLLSGSDEGTVCVVDHSQLDGDEGLMMVLPHDHAVHRIEACGGSNISIQTQTQRFSVWNAETGECIVDYGDMRMGSEFYPQQQRLKPSIVSVAGGLHKFEQLIDQSASVEDPTFFSSNHPDADLMRETTMQQDQQNGNHSLLVDDDDDNDDGECHEEKMKVASGQFVYSCPQMVIGTDEIPIDHFNVDFLIDSMFDSSTDQLYVVSGSNSGSIHILKASVEGITALQSLIGGHSSLVRSVFWDPFSHTIHSCGEEGRLCVWKPLSCINSSSPSSSSSSSRFLPSSSSSSSSSSSGPPNHDLGPFPSPSPSQAAHSHSHSHSQSPSKTSNRLSVTPKKKNVHHFRPY